MPSRFEGILSRCFSSVDTLRQTFLDMAEAMFGPGFVWLVALRNPNPFHPNVDSSITGEFKDISSRSNNHGQGFDFRILPTYIAGSPYPGAHARQQNRDMNTQNLESIQGMVQNTAGAFGASSEAARGDDTTNARRGGADVIPVLCVNTWEHAWMMDWGVDGKRQFLEMWWERIDWGEVWRRANVGSTQDAMYQSPRGRSTYSYRDVL